jgi:hypothetical protein
MFLPAAAERRFDELTVQERRETRASGTRCTGIAGRHRVSADAIDTKTSDRQRGVAGFVSFDANKGVHR